MGAQSTNLVPLFRKVVIGAAEASLDVAGGALLPGAWPLLKGALQPVLDRLKERLGGKEVTGDLKTAQKAVKAFEADLHLQEILRSKLLEQLDNLVQRQQAINTDMQKLMLIVSGDRQLLNKLVGGMERIEQRLDAGVNLSDEAVQRLAGAISSQAENSRRIRAIALREMGPIGELTQRQVQRLQIRAVELVQEGAPDRAVDELKEGLLLVGVLLSEAPTDITLRLQLGMIYKTASQVFDQAGDPAHAAEYLKLAEELFRSIKDDVGADEKTAVDMANSIHGLGNVDHGRGDFLAAIEKYKLATTLNPAHMYAWHDMFGAYYELATRGEVNLKAMREALDQVKKTGLGAPGLSAHHIAELEQLLAEFGKKAAAPPRIQP